jgi:dipeptidyl-peptidase 4
MYQLLVVLIFISMGATAQPGIGRQQWTNDGEALYEIKNNEVVKTRFPAMDQKTIAGGAALNGLSVRRFTVSDNEQQVLICTNTKKVWRYDTRGDYFVYQANQKKVQKIGGKLPASSLMFAKLSPDGAMAAYTDYYNHNLYTENLATGEIKQLTKDGSRKLINGTFDWVYEEEFGCRDGFRWSPDGKKIAFWQIDGTATRDYYMLNTTDSIYSKVVPVEYPKAGEDPSPCRIGVIDLVTGSTTWMKIPGEANKNFLPRMEWAANNTEIIVQQLNRRQNESILYICTVNNGDARKIISEKNNNWIDIKSAWNGGSNDGWEWLANGQEFLWVSEKDGWRHCYRVSRDGSSEKLVTNGNYDIITLNAIDEKNNYLYFIASPKNATQKYLYRTKLDGSGTAERITPQNLTGTSDYKTSPGAKYSFFSFSATTMMPVETVISLPDHKSLNKKFVMPTPSVSITEFIKIKTADGIELDGWMVKPKNFNPAKKYPVVFYVYGEPASQTVTDEFGTGYNFLYKGDMAEDGYIYMSFDNRGTPAPKGSEWRKSIYRRIGQVNIRDQAMAAKEILKLSYIDKTRVAVWGWSGGGTTTLHLLLQYPDIYTCGIAVAPVSNLACYDNIYEERYMGLPQEAAEDYKKGSAINYVKNLKGKLLYIHGTGDDNVHYQNSELFLNEVIRYGKQIQFFPYPNRTHGISEGEGTTNHLMDLYTSFLRANCVPGAK